MNWNGRSGSVDRDSGRRDGAADEATVKVQRNDLEQYDEHVDLSFVIRLRFSGGWDCEYYKNKGKTLLEGSLTVSDGTAVIRNVVIGN